jgi:hypothetical protein
VKVIAQAIELCGTYFGFCVNELHILASRVLAEDE